MYEDEAATDGYGFMRDQCELTIEYHLNLIQSWLSFSSHLPFGLAFVSFAAPCATFAKI